LPAWAQAAALQANSSVLPKDTHLYFGREQAAMIFGAGLWRLLETAFVIFMAVGVLAGLSYLYKPVLKLIRRKSRTK
jgi:hypothetical protein